MTFASVHPHYVTGGSAEARRTFTTRLRPNVGDRSASAKRTRGTSFLRKKSCAKFNAAHVRGVLQGELPSSPQDGGLSFPSGIGEQVPCVVHNHAVSSVAVAVGVGP